MINYIDYYFEAQKEKPLKLKPTEPVKTEPTEPEPIKTVWGENWTEIKNIFLELTGGGVWKEVESDFKSSVGKWGPPSAQSTRPWRKFYELLFDKIEQNHSNKNTPTWTAPNLEDLQEEVVNYVLMKSITGFNDKGNIICNKNIKDTLKKIVDLNSISKTNFTEFKGRFETDNTINLIKFPHLKVFLSHPYHMNYYDSRIPVFMKENTGPVRGQKLAEYTGYFSPSNNISKNLASSLKSTSSKYLKESKEELKAFIKNVYLEPDDTVKEIIEIQAGLGNFLPPLKTITDNPAHEKLARNILYQLSIFKKDLDITEILETFLFFYNKIVASKVSPDSHELTPKAQKELKELKNELADAIKKLKKAEEIIDKNEKTIAITKKISPDQKYVINNAKIDVNNLKNQISSIKDQLEPYEWSDNSISNFIDNADKSIQKIRDAMVDIVRDSGKNRKYKKIESGEIDATKKYLEELAQALKNLKKEVKEKFLEIWKTYGDFLLGGDSNTQFKDQWGAIEDEFTAYLNQKLETKLNSLNLPKGRVRDELLAKTKASAEATIDEIRKSSLISFNNYKQELKDIKKTYEKLSKQQRGFIRNVIRDTDGKFFKKVIEQLWKNRKDIQKRNIDDIINNGLEKDSSPEEIKAEIGAEIKKETETLNKEIKKAENSRTMVDWLSVPEVIKFIKTNFTDPEDKTLYGWISTVKNDSHLYSLKDVYRELHLVKKDSERAEIENLRIGESTNPLINSILKRHILQ